MLKDVYIHSFLLLRKDRYERRHLENCELTRKKGRIDILLFLVHNLKQVKEYILSLLQFIVQNTVMFLYTCSCSQLYIDS